MFTNCTIILIGPQPICIRIHAPVIKILSTRHGDVCCKLTDVIHTFVYKIFYRKALLDASFVMSQCKSGKCPCSGPDGMLEHRCGKVTILKSYTVVEYFPLTIAIFMQLTILNFELIWVYS